MIIFFCDPVLPVVARIDIYHKMPTEIQLSLHGTSLPYPQGIRCHQFELGKGKNLLNKMLCIAIQIHANVPDDVHCQVILTLSDGNKEERHALISGQMTKDKPWHADLFLLTFKKKRGL